MTTYVITAKQGWPAEIAKPTGGEGSMNRIDFVDVDSNGKRELIADFSSKKADGTWMGQIIGLNSNGTSMPSFPIIARDNVADSGFAKNLFLGASTTIFTSDLIAINKYDASAKKNGAINVGTINEYGANLLINESKTLVYNETACYDMTGTKLWQYNIDVPIGKYRELNKIASGTDLDGKALTAISWNLYDTNSAYTDGYITVVDSTGKELTNWPLRVGTNNAGCKLINIDSKGTKGILVYGEKHIAVYEKDGTLAWEENGAVFKGIGDINKDGIDEVLSLPMSDSSPFYMNVLRVTKADGTKKDYTIPFTQINGIAHADFVGDGTNQILVQGSDKITGEPTVIGMGGASMDILFSFTLPHAANIKFTNFNAIDVDGDKIVEFFIEENFKDASGAYPVRIDSYEIKKKVTDVSDSLNVDIFNLSCNPNPSSGEVSIEVNNSSSSKTEVTITDTLGNIVMRHQSESTGEAKQFLNWDSKDENGNSVASGVYFVTMISSDRSITQMLVINR